MNLYVISPDENDCYDTFDSAVVVAANEEEARHIHPGGAFYQKDDLDRSRSSWVDPEHVMVRLIGKAVEYSSAGVVLASFNSR